MKPLNLLSLPPVALSALSVIDMRKVRLVPAKAPVRCRTERPSDYDKLKEGLKDSADLLERASIDLGSSESTTHNLPKDQRVARARSGLDDPELGTWGVEDG
ncbi:hypothetical protein BJX99DRAFT_253201 [Aspergillus californicus]